MGYFGDVWSNLVFNTGNASTQFITSLTWRYRNNQVGTGLEYKSRSAYKSVLVHVAKQLAASLIEGELNSFVPKYQQHIMKLELDMRDEALAANTVDLIANQNKCFTGYGKLPFSDYNHTFIAKTQYGDPVPEALIISFVDDSGQKYKYKDVVWGKNRGKYTVKKKGAIEKLWNPGTEIEYTPGQTAEVTIETATVFHVDLTPQISMNSTKNVVLTQVQGRDFTRKELVSGGDLSYSVNGYIVSDQIDVYPEEAVKRFVKIMQYAGILDVIHPSFGVLGVKKVIIKDFSLNAPTYKNIQPYSFTCVAVEPDEQIKLAEDTVGAVNKILSESTIDAWYYKILNNKLAEMAAKAAVGAATSAASSLTGAGLDALGGDNI